MTNEWRTNRLIDVCKVFVDGDWIEKKDQSDDGIRLIQTGNVGNSQFKDKGDHARFISEATFKRLHCTEVLPGDCLISRLPDPVGRSCIVPDIGIKMITAVDCTIARFKSEIMLTEYFKYYSQSTQYLSEVDHGTTGTTRKRISRKNLGQIAISYPSIEEQKRIVKILDEAFEKIEKAKENTEKNLQNSRELFESYLQTVFLNNEDWDNKKLADLFTIKPPKKEAFEKLKNDDLVSFLPMEDLGINAKEFVINKERKLQEVAGSYTYFANEDILLAKITPCFENGKLGIARNLKNGLGFGSSEYIVLRSHGEIIPDFLYYFLAREQFRKEGKNRMSGAVGHKRVSKEFIEDYVFSYPKPISQQQEIVKKLDQLSEQTKKLEQNYRQKLADLEELKKSILNKAFAGEL